MAENHNSSLSPEVKEKLSKIKHLALDMDGTIYLGGTLFPFTKKFLADMTEAGITYSFLTNNPSISVASFALSGDLDPSDEGVKYILYVLESPENIDLITEMWGKLA